MQRRGRRLLSVMAIWLVIGQLVVDRCLIRCHADAQAPAAASEPACHAAHADNSASRWQVATVCNHDHRTPSAEAIARVGPESPLTIAAARPAVDAFATAIAARAAIADTAASPPGTASPAALARPLRV